MPTDGYLEGPGGPVSFSDIEWIEISMKRVKGGIAGHPLQFIDAKDQILTYLRAAQVKWELHNSTWSVPGIFEGEPVEVVRVANLFKPTPRP